MTNYDTLQPPLGYSQGVVVVASDVKKPAACVFVVTM